MPGFLPSFWSATIDKLPLKRFLPIPFISKFLNFSVGQTSGNLVANWSKYTVQFQMNGSV